MSLREAVARHSSGPPVVMFLSTGRCGTQWLTAALRELHPELAVEHEPIGPLYSPRRYFRRYADPDAVLEVAAVAEHLARVAAESRTYVETGWPLFSALPLLAEVMPQRLRVIHLVRHPVPTALSHLAHSSWADSPRDDAFTRLATLGPRDPGVLHPEYAKRWPDLTAYEKCLYWWTEVHAFGLEFAERFPDVPLRRVRAEELLGGDPAALAAVLEPVGLASDSRLRERLEQVVDRWHHHTDQAVDPHLVRRHPATVELARRLGYDVEALDVAALQARYRGRPDAGADRHGRFAETPRRQAPSGSTVPGVSEREN